MKSRSQRNLRLLTGRAGSGKTAYCLELFREKILASAESGLGQPSFYILPSSEHTERIYALLLRDRRFDGVLNLHVCTINDFIRMKVTGGVRKVVSHADRARIVRRILSEGEWPWLGRARHTKGLAFALADFVREIKRSDGGVADYARASAKVALQDRYHASKSADLKALLERYDAACREIGVSDPEDQIREYARSIAENGDSLAVDLAVFDGFFSFSGTQRLFIEAVAGRSRSAIVTLTLDPRPSRGHVFVHALETREWLARAGFSETALAPEGYRFRAPGPARVEEALFEPGAAASGDARGLTIFEAASPRREVEMIAREIRRLAREEGLHYSDFMIVLRDVAACRDLFESVFTEFDLPCEVHERKRFADHPLGRFLADWSAVFAPGAGADAWNRFLRSAYLGLDPAVALEAESALAAAPEGGARQFLLGVTLSPGAGAALQSVREAWDRWSAARDAMALRKAVESFAAWGAGLRESGASAEDAREDQVVLEALEEILDNVSFYSARSGAFSFSEACDHLAARIETALYSPPAPGKNRVQIYNTALAMQKEYRVVFVSGLEEGRFPRQAAPDAVLSDAERAELRESGFALDTRASRGSGERYYFYMAATRARDRLYLTRAAADSDGRVIAPSHFLSAVRRCFAPGAIPVSKDSSIAVPEFARASSRREFARILAGTRQDRGDETKLAAEVLRAVLEPAALPALTASFRALRRENRLENAEARGALSRIAEPLSATRLKRLANCSYQHFADYQLKLRRHDPRDSAPVQNGNILHDALEKAYARLFAKPDAKTPVEPELARAFVEELQKSFALFPVTGEKPYRSALRLSELRRKLEDFAGLEVRRFEANPGYRPDKFEWKFRFQIDLGGVPVRVTGKIDRVDVDAESGRAWILDYKSNYVPGHVDLRRGEDVQTPLYLWAIEKEMNLRPRGIEFVSLTSGKSARFARNLPGEKPGAEASGWLDEKLFEESLENMRAILAGHVQKMRDADIAADSDSCRNCDYQVLCRFEDWRLKRS